MQSTPVVSCIVSLPDLPVSTIATSLRFPFWRQPSTVFCKGKQFQLLIGLQRRFERPACAPRLQRLGHNRIFAHDEIGQSRRIIVGGKAASRRRFRHDCRQRHGSIPHRIVAILKRDASFLEVRHAHRLFSSLHPTDRTARHLSLPIPQAARQSRCARRRKRHRRWSPSFCK